MVMPKETARVPSVSCLDRPMPPQRRPRRPCLRPQPAPAQLAGPAGSRTFPPARAGSANGPPSQLVAGSPVSLARRGFRAQAAEGVSAGCTACGLGQAAACRLLACEQTAEGVGPALPQPARAGIGSRPRAHAQARPAPNPKSQPRRIPGGWLLTKRVSVRVLFGEPNILTSSGVYFWLTTATRTHPKWPILRGNVLSRRVYVQPEAAYPA